MNDHMELEGFERASLIGVFFLYELHFWTILLKETGRVLPSKGDT